MKRAKTRVRFWAWLLAMAMLVTLVPLLPAKGAGEAEAAAATKKIFVKATVRYDYAWQVLEETNKKRAEAGVAPLVMDMDLLEDAMQRCAENVVVLAATGHLSHDRPDGTAFWKVGSQKSYTENLASGQMNPDAVVAAWMASEAGHREALLDPEAVSVGVGVLQVGDVMHFYWAQEFNGEAAKTGTQPVNGKRVFSVDAAAELYDAAASNSDYSKILITSGTWKKSAKGWWYKYPDGSCPIAQWLQISGKWYYFDAAGYMVTGWQNIGGKWYYFAADGAMKTGWLQISGKWYFLNPSGVMTTGWKKISKVWYYFNGGGIMKTGWLKLGGKWYYFTGSGAMVTGTQTIGGKTYRFDSSGVCLNP